MCAGDFFRDGFAGGFDDRAARWRSKGKGRMEIYFLERADH
jgi:hypothetical protein